MTSMLKITAVASKLTGTGNHRQNRSAKGPLCREEEDGRASKRNNKNNFWSDTPVGGWTSTLLNHLFFPLFSPSPSPPPKHTHTHTQLKYAEVDFSKPPDTTGEGPDTSGKAPEAEAPVVYTTVKTD